MSFERQKLHYFWRSKAGSHPVSDMGGSELGGLYNTLRTNSTLDVVDMPMPVLLCGHHFTFALGGQARWAHVASAGLRANLLFRGVPTKLTKRDVPFCV